MYGAGRGRGRIGAVVAATALALALPAAAGPMPSWQPLDRPWGTEGLKGIGLGADGGLVVVTDTALWRAEPGGRVLTPDRRYRPPPLLPSTRVAFVPGTDELWVAEARRALRWRDGEWEEHPTTQVAPYALAFSGPDDGWIGGQNNIVERWDGRRWTPVRDPALPDVATDSALDIAPVGRGEAWLALENSPILHDTGGPLAPLPPLPDGAQVGGGLGSLSHRLCALPDGRVAFVQGDLYLWDGAGWGRIGAPGPVRLCAVDGEGQLWAAGLDGLLVRLEGGQLVRASVPNSASMSGVVFDGQGVGFALTSVDLLRTSPASEFQFHAVAPTGGIDDGGKTDHALFMALDRDPHPDLLLVTWPDDVRLFRNGGDWTFTDASEAAGIGGGIGQEGVVEACDLDGDGASEVLTWWRGEQQLHQYRNLGDGRFEEASPPGPAGAGPVTVEDLDCADLDGDGDLDVYVTCIYDDGQRPAPNLVYENRGAGRLRGVLPATRGLGGWRDWTFQSAFVDLDGDAFSELVSSVLWSRRSRVLRRLPDGRWEDATADVGLGVTAPWGNVSLPADLDGDGDFDLLMLESRGRSRFYRNDGGRLVDLPLLDGRPLTSRPSADQDALSGAAIDLDGDRDVDLLLRDPRAGARVLLNDGGLRLRDVSADAGLPVRGVRSVALADVDADGDPDLYVGRGNRYRNQLMENPRRGEGRSVRLGSLRSSVAGATVELLDQDGQLLQLLRYPDSGLGVLLAAPTGDGERLRVRLSDGTTRELPAPGPGASTLQLERGPGRLLLAARRSLHRRIAWADRDDELLRGILALLGLALVVTLARRRGTIWLSRPKYGLALLGAYAGLALATAPLAAPWRSVGLAAWLLGLAGLTWLDRRLSRLRRATWVAHFRLERNLGSGAAGTVWLARDTARNRTVALKILHPELTEKDFAPERFRREAEVGARFRHRNLVEVYEYGECQVFDGDRPRGARYLSMEYVDGRSLRAWLRERSQIPLGQACRIAVAVLRGLAAIHEAGVVHRDLKPDNVMISAGGRVKVTDYGLARGPGIATLTASTDIVGTLAYMAPEQARSPRPTAAADLWAVGVMLYEMLAGRRPYVADEALALVFLILNEDPPGLEELGVRLPGPVAAAIRRAMERDVERRWPAAADFSRVLEPYADPEVSTRLLSSARGQQEEPAGWRQALEQQTTAGGPPGLELPKAEPSDD